GGQVRRRGDRLLRRALHGRVGVDPLAGEDRPAARPRRGLLAGRLDHARPAEDLAGQASRRHHRHVRQHDRRDQGAHRLLRDLVERRQRRAPHPRRARAGHRDPVRAGHVPRRVRREGDRPQDARVGRRVPRPRRHPPERHRRDPRRAPGRRLPHPPRVRLLDVGHGVRRRGRRRLRGRAHALHRRDARLRQAGRARLDRDHGDRGRDAPSAQARRAAGRLRRRQRGGELPLHEDDHAAEAPRRAARHEARGEGPRAHRRARPRADRADGLDRRL
ncbi:MAG: Quinolinate synthetase, partial [uncultured Solirubrobacteraceae bacterium]